MEINRQNNNRNELHIDNVLSSQPELGPSVPDGGYGWVILAGSLFFQGLIPSISVGLGVFVLFSRLENSAPAEPSLWDNNVVYASLFFIAVWTVAEPTSRYLCSTSTWPRLVATAGTCLTCAGLLISWFGINNGNSAALFALSGILAGSGASIVLTQTDVLISQYFHLKMDAVKIVLHAVTAFGFILTPILLGDNIVKIGMLQVITWYQAIILQGILVSITFRKPKHLKLHRKKYKLVRGLSDDEEDIFAKNTTELQNPRPISNSNSNISPKEETLASIPSSSNKVFTQSTSNGDITQKISKETISTTVEVTPSNWEKFEDEPVANQIQSTKTQINLHKTFATDFSNDLDRIDQLDDTYTEIPKPLFSETQINNNTSYSYEAPVEIEDPVVFMPNSKIEDNSSWRKNIEILKQPTFYKSLLFLITTKFSVFTFWSLFPSYLYVRIDYLKVHHTTVVLGCVSIGSLLFATLTTWIKVNAKTRAIFLWIFCWMGTVGYITLSDSQKETLLIFGAVDITLSISALQILGMPLMKTGIRGETSRSHVLLSILTGVSLILFLLIDMSYRNCFRLAALLQFLTGSLWLSNFIYKKIKKQISRR